MNKILIGIIFIFTSVTVFAAEISSPSLKMKLIDNVKNQKISICLTNTCYQIKKNAEINVKIDKLDSIVLTNTTNKQMFPQILPPSCTVTIQKHQLLTMSAIVEAKNNVVVLSNINCSMTDIAL